MSKTIIGRGAAVTLPELIEVLQEFSVDTDPDTVYVTINSDYIHLRLVEETLTDGSIVYSIELEEASK